MKIIRATAKYIDDIARLNNVVQELHVAREPGLFRPVDAAAVREGVRTALEDPAVTFLLAVEDEAPLGYALVRICERPENAYRASRTFLELDQIAVAPDARKRGVGSALIDAAFALAQSLDIPAVELSVWHFNDEAQRLFSRKGFKTCWQRMRSDAS